MRKPSSKIREEIAKLQEQLRAAETREAERIGRIALRAGLGEWEVEESELQAAFEDVAERFRGGPTSIEDGSKGKERGGANAWSTPANSPGETSSSAVEA